MVLGSSKTKYRGRVLDRVVQGNLTQGSASCRLISEVGRQWKTNHWVHVHDA